MYIHTYIHTHTYSNLRMYTHTFIHSYLHRYTHTYLDTRIANENACKQQVEMKNTLIQKLKIVIEKHEAHIEYLTQQVNFKYYLLFVQMILFRNIVT